MSNQSSYVKTAAGQSSTGHRCPVCGAGYSTLFSVQRHLGVKHMLDVSGCRITKERQAYLRHQSDRRYVRNGERKSDDQSTETGIESIIPSQQASTAARESYFEPANLSSKLVLVEPAALHEMMKSRNYSKSDQDTYEDDDDDMAKDTGKSLVFKQSQQAVLTSKRVRRQSQKTKSLKSSSWSCY